MSTARPLVVVASAVGDMLPVCVAALPPLNANAIEGIGALAVDIVWVAGVPLATSVWATLGVTVATPPEKQRQIKYSVWLFIPVNVDASDPSTNRQESMSRMATDAVLPPVSARMVNPAGVTAVGIVELVDVYPTLPMTRMSPATQPDGLFTVVDDDVVEFRSAITGFVFGFPMNPGAKTPRRKSTGSGKRLARMMAGFGGVQIFASGGMSIMSSNPRQQSIHSLRSYAALPWRIDRRASARFGF